MSRKLNCTPPLELLRVVPFKALSPDDLAQFTPGDVNRSTMEESEARYGFRVTGIHLITVFDGF